MVKMVNENPSKTEILNKLHRAQSEYDAAYNMLRQNKSIENRLVYGAVKDDMESSIKHLRRQIKWISTEGVRD